MFSRIAALVAPTWASDAGGGNLVKFELDSSAYPDAVCLDGSPAAYYYQRAQDEDGKPPAQVTKWVLYLEGGGWCYDEVDCYHRSSTHLGSSVGYSTQGQAPAEMYDKEGSTFAGYNRVYVKYCDGSSFAGDRDDPVTVKGKPLYFRGRRILHAVLDDLRTGVSSPAIAWLNYTRDLAEATHFALIGSSAGGLATFVHANFVGDYLRDHAKGLVQYGAMPVSGFFLDVPNAVGADVYGKQMRYIAQLSNAKNGLDQRCVQNTGSDWPRCIFANESYAHVQYPIFVVNSNFDSWATGCIFGAVLPDGFPAQTGEKNGVCGKATETWSTCDGGYPTSCCDEDLVLINSWQLAFTKTLQSVPTYGQAGNGAFVHNRHMHMAADGREWDDSRGHTMIDGVRMVDAVNAWWLQFTPSTPALDNTHYCYVAPNFTKYGGCDNDPSARPEVVLV